MSSYQGKIVKHTKRQETQFEETEQVSETEMAEILELSYWKDKKKIYDYYARVSNGKSR